MTYLFCMFHLFCCCFERGRRRHGVLSGTRHGHKLQLVSERLCCGGARVSSTYTVVRWVFGRPNTTTCCGTHVCRWLLLLLLPPRTAATVRATLGLARSGAFGSRALFGVSLATVCRVAVTRPAGRVGVAAVRALGAALPQVRHVVSGQHHAPTSKGFRDARHAASRCVRRRRRRCRRCCRGIAIIIVTVAAGAGGACPDLTSLGCRRRRRRRRRQGRRAHHGTSDATEGDLPRFRRGRPAAHAFREQPAQGTNLWGTPRVGRRVVFTAPYHATSRHITQARRSSSSSTRHTHTHTHNIHTHTRALSVPPTHHAGM